MTEFLRGFVVWWNRRRRFAEEWTFHLSMARSELEALGMSPTEARQLARRRLGSRMIHRRAAMREMGADVKGLLELLPMRRIQRSAYLAPFLLVAVIGSALVFNPARGQVIESMYRLLPFADAVIVERMIPLAPTSSVPVGFSAITLWILLLVGWARIVIEFVVRRDWRICIYAGVVLCGIAAVGSLCWATGMQILLRWRWGSDLIQGVALGLFQLGYWWSPYGAWRLWWRDVARRCPVCLRLPGMPDVRGKASDVLLEPREVESICLHGHGLVVESRWSSRFERSLHSLFQAGIRCVPASIGRKGKRRFV